MSSLSARLLNRLESRQARVGVVGWVCGLAARRGIWRSGLTAVGIDLALERRCRPGASLIPDFRRRSRLFRASGHLHGTPTFACRSRHGQRLRADAAAEDEGPGHVLHHLRDRGDRRAPSRWHARHSRVDDVSGHDRRARAASARAARPEGRGRFLPRVLARACRSGQPGVQHPTYRRSWAAPTRFAASSRARCTPTSIETVVPVSSPRRVRNGEAARNTFRAVNIGS